jgi:hypothetical protein
MVRRRNSAPRAPRFALVPIAAAVACLIAGSAAAQSNDDWTPTKQQVAHVQAVIAPTQVAVPIKVRNQYWTGMNADGRQVIFGVLVKRELDLVHRKPGGRPAVEIRALNAMPGFFNYGCDAVFVVFDVLDDRLDKLFCSGGFDLRTPPVGRSDAPAG